jgi:hypothetical protein
MAVTQSLCSWRMPAGDDPVPTGAHQQRAIQSQSRPTYIRVRRVLLDELEALRAHERAVILVGAHAVYLHTALKQRG